MSEKPAKLLRLVLHVEDNPADAELVRAYLDESPDEHYEIHHVPDLATAARQNENVDFDVVLLDLQLPDGMMEGNITQLRKRLGEVPILVLTGMDDDELGLACIERGAQDYLLKNEIKPRNLRRAIGYAITRKREAELREAHEVLERYRELGSDGMSAPVTAQISGNAPIKARPGANWEEVVKVYCALLQQYVDRLAEQRAAPREPMQQLINRLGNLGAGPRDIVDLHLTALDLGRFAEQGTENRAMIVEGRLMALEMMGLLVDYYRIGHRRRN